MSRNDGHKEDSMSTIDERTTYEVNVTPLGFDGLTPTYEVSVYRYVEAGVCGPASDKVEVTGLEGVDEWLDVQGFERVSDFGDVCSNGFATAELVRL